MRPTLRAAKSLIKFALAFVAMTPAARSFESGTQILVSLPDQELALVKDGRKIVCYPVSTSKFGTGDEIGTYRTPVGTLFVSSKMGDNLPAGAVIKSRMPTGEVLSANTPGRDPIVSRVIWLRGMESGNQNAHERCIYIHGTPEEKRVGRRASFGCIRMRSKDVIALYNLVHIGMRVIISEKSLSEILPAEEPSLLARGD